MVSLSLQVYSMFSGRALFYCSCDISSVMTSSPSPSSQPGQMNNCNTTCHISLSVTHSGMRAASVSLLQFPLPIARPLSDRLNCLIIRLDIRPATATHGVAPRPVQPHYVVILPYASRSKSGTTTAHCSEIPNATKLVSWPAPFGSLELWIFGQTPPRSAKGRDRIG